MASHVPIALLAMNPRSFTDIESDFRTLGRIVNPAATSEKVIHKMQHESKEVARYASLTRHCVKSRVYCEAWPNPRMSSLPWVAELVEIAGDRMIVLGGACVTDRDVANPQPDVMVLVWTAAGDRVAPKHAFRKEA
jgi:ABC-type Fe3+-hydroxamate transport system substrate-binding protein